MMVVRNEARKINKTRRAIKIHHRAGSSAFDPIFRPTEPNLSSRFGVLCASRVNS